MGLYIVTGIENGNVPLGFLITLRLSMTMLAITDAQTSLCLLSLTLQVANKSVRKFSRSKSVLRIPKNELSESPVDNYHKTLSQK